MRDKRRCHRINMKLPAACFFSDDSEAVSASTLDISGLGLCLIMRTKPQISQSIKVQIELPNGETVAIKVSVVWVKVMCDALTDEYRVGVKIDESIPKDEKKFVQYFAEIFNLSFPKDGPSQ